MNLLQIAAILQYLIHIARILLQAPKVDIQMLQKYCHDIFAIISAVSALIADFTVSRIL